MLDALAKIVSSQTADLSGATTTLYTHNTVGGICPDVSKYVLGAGGLPEMARMTVVRHNSATLANKTDVELQYSTDGGTTWFTAGGVTIPSGKADRLSDTIGLRDIVPELQNSASIWVRAVLRGPVTSTQVVTVSVWLGYDRAYPQSV